MADNKQQPHEPMSADVLTSVFRSRPYADEDGNTEWHYELVTDGDITYGEETVFEGAYIVAETPEAFSAFLKLVREQ